MGSTTGDDAENQKIAQRLVSAWRTATVTEPPSAQVAELDSIRALQITRHSTALLGPDRVVGYKIGLVAESAQQAMGYAQPVFGRIYADDVSASGATLSRSAFVDPKIEPECGLLIGSHLGGADVSTEEVRRAVAGVVPAFEIADSRYGAAASTVGDLIADNGAAAGAVITLSDAIPPNTIDLSSTRLTVELDGEPTWVDRPMPGGPSNDQPYELLGWLVRTLATQELSLEPGQFVLTGSWVTPIDASGPITVQASYSGFGTVSVTMS